MSYDYKQRSFNGRRRPYRDDYYDDRHREVVESPQEKLRNAILKLSEVDPVEELPRLETQIRETTPVAINSLSETFHFGVTEQPYKIPHYTALLRLLHNPSRDADDSMDTSLGRQILDEFWKGFQAYLDKLSWRETRFCIHFFAHLTAAHLVSPESMLSLLQSFTAVLDEFGVSHGRANQAALCAAEGLMIAGPILKTTSRPRVAEIINAIEVYSDTVTSPKWIVQPMIHLHANGASSENIDELFDMVLSALKGLDKLDFIEDYDSFIRPYSDYSRLDSDFVPFDLPSILVPPEVIEIDGLSSEAGGEDTPVKKDEWPVYFIRLFENDVTPDPTTPAGYAVRSALLGIIDVFEVNRKECARILLEYPKWTQPGTFKPRPGSTVDFDPIPGKDWQLESTLIETILATFLISPESSHKSIYYIALIAELCKLSAATIGPALGKSIRKLYGHLADGLDVDLSRRFAEWFSTHMSNFNFQWVWKEWLPDLNLALEHPKRMFIRRAVEFEIRLSYYDRIAKTLPEQMQDPEARILPPHAPGPNFEYDDPAQPHHDAAQSVLNLLRGRTKAEDVISHLDSLKTTLEASEDNVDGTLRSIAIQSLLHIGSRSFSHLLNAIERYLPLLRSLASGGASTAQGSGNQQAKADILTASAVFWRSNPQMISIVFDKFMQYQIADPTDIVDWVFSSGQDVLHPENRGTANLYATGWDLLRAALDKANGRLVLARRKLAALKKEDEENRARVNARSMDVDEGQNEEAPAEENVALTTAVKGLGTLTKEQKTALSKTLDGFVLFLVPLAGTTNANPETRNILVEKAWHNRANWGADEWNAWQTWGFYRQFCRLYAPYLRNYATTLSTVSFARLQGLDNPAADLVQKMFSVSTGDY